MNRQVRQMSNIDPEKRKDLRRNNLKKKTLEKRSSDNIDYKDQHKLKKQYKKHIEEIEQEELWEEWKNEIR